MTSGGPRGTLSKNILLERRVSLMDSSRNREDLATKHLYWRSPSSGFFRSARPTDGPIRFIELGNESSESSPPLGSSSARLRMCRPTTKHNTRASLSISHDRKTNAFCPLYMHDTFLITTSSYKRSAARPRAVSTVAPGPPQALPYTSPI
jgi:hypothetical protein